MHRYLLLLAVALILSCQEKREESKQVSEEITKDSLSYNEPFRPQFHFTPPSHWMNDPNGLVYHQGIYHLFYQYYPDDIVWGPMHWGHATSTDMIHWDHQPIALYPDELGLIFSGSAVVDVDNTSGFGSEANPPLVAIYTYHLMAGEQAGTNDFQTQGIAYSLDNGATWTKYEGNPVIGNDGIKDFRDPKVFWHEDSKKWVMALVAGDHAKFYSSSNLKEWKLMSEFGKDKGAHGGVWECPDLFKLPVDDTGEEKWVLIISINPGAPNGGSGTQYFVGDFDGTTFTTTQTKNKWLDYGRDNYAGVTYNNTPNDERIFIGWMSNWDYARDTPTEVWRSAMTLPRNISLHKDATGYFIRNYPIEAVDSIATNLLKKETVALETPFVLKNKNYNRSEIRFEANLSHAAQLALTSANGERIQFNINPETKELLFDRTASGMVNFQERFAGEVQRQSYTPKDQWAEIRIVLDASSVEIFVDKGRYVFTNQIFPKTPYVQLELTGAKDSVLKNFEINQLNSIWKHE